LEDWTISDLPVECANIIGALAQTECELLHRFPSTMAKYSCFGSAVRSANGNTAIVGLPAATI
jgi:hypothetical protein